MALGREFIPWRPANFIATHKLECLLIKKLSVLK